MKELSLHILDVAENGIAAGADRIRIAIDENTEADRLRIVISDNGRGIPAEKIALVHDPFYTTRTTRRVGLGLSLLESAAKRCDGFMTIESTFGHGTTVTAQFRYGHIDRAPLGDMAGTLFALILGNPDIDFDYHHARNEKTFDFDTRKIKNEQGNRPVTHPGVMAYLMRLIRQGLAELAADGEPDA